MRRRVREEGRRVGGCEDGRGTDCPRRRLRKARRRASEDWARPSLSRRPFPAVRSRMTRYAMVPYCRGGEEGRQSNLVRKGNGNCKLRNADSRAEGCAYSKSHSLSTKQDYKGGKEIRLTTRVSQSRYSQSQSDSTASFSSCSSSLDFEISRKLRFSSLSFPNIDGKDRSFKKF